MSNPGNELRNSFYMNTLGRLPVLKWEDLASKTQKEWEDNAVHDGTVWKS